MAAIPLGRASEAKNADALPALALLLLCYALWELSAWLTRRRLLKAHPKRRQRPAS